MPRSFFAYCTMGIIVLIILLMMCTYQVRFTEAAVVTRFDRILADRGTEPGLHWKWPFIERVHKFDARLRTFESQFRQQSTRDQRSIVMTVFATWRIDDLPIVSMLQSTAYSRATLTTSGGSMPAGYDMALAPSTEQPEEV